MVSRSSVETEYEMMTILTYEFVWVKNPIELRFTLRFLMRLYYDNQVVIPVVEKHIYFTSTQNTLR